MVRKSPSPAPGYGDANMDGQVDLTDLSTVLNNFGKSTVLWTDGNFDGQPTIDLTDLSDVLNNFGSSAPSASTPVIDPANDEVGASTSPESTSTTSTPDAGGVVDAPTPSPNVATTTTPATSDPTDPAQLHRPISLLAAPDNSVTTTSTSTTENMPTGTIPVPTPSAAETPRDPSSPPTAPSAAPAPDDAAPSIAPPTSTISAAPALTVSRPQRLDVTTPITPTARNLSIITTDMPGNIALGATASSEFLFIPMRQESLTAQSLAKPSGLSMAVGEQLKDFSRSSQLTNDATPEENLVVDPGPGNFSFLYSTLPQTSGSHTIELVALDQPL